MLHRIPMVHLVRTTLLVFLFLAWFGHTPIRATPCDLVLQELAPWSLTSPERSLEAATKVLMAVFDRPLGRKISFPESLGSSSASAQRETASYFYRTGDVVVRELLSIQEELDRSPETRLTPMSVLDRVHRSIKSHHMGDRISSNSARSNFDRMRRRAETALNRSSAGDISFSRINAILGDFKAFTAGLSETFGSQYLNEAQINKAGFDVFAMFMLSDIFGKSLLSKEAIYSIALLHPVTDSALDPVTDSALGQSVDVSKTMAKVTRLLKREPVVADNEYEKLLFHLIGTIQTAFPPHDHPFLQWTWLRLHEEQLKSVTLQDSANPSAQDIVSAAFRKGGLTYLIFAYLALGKLDESEIGYFYGAGAYLQLVDDLLDVDDDLREERNSPWTLSILEGGRVGAVQTLNRMMNVLAEISKSSHALLPEHAAGRMRSSFDFASGLFLLGALMNPEVRPYIRKAMVSRQPMEIEAMEAVVFSILANLSQGDHVEQLFVKILDKGFLNGRFYEQLTDDEKRGYLSMKTILSKIQGWRGIKARWGDRMHRWYRGIISSKRTAAQEMQFNTILIGVVSAYLFGSYKLFEASNYPDLLGFLLITNGALAISGQARALLYTSMGGITLGSVLYFLHQWSMYPLF